MKFSFRPLLFTLITASCAIPTLSIRPAHAVAVDSISLENASFFDSGVVRDDTAQLFEMPQFDTNSNARPAPLTLKGNRSILAKAAFSVTPNNVTETVKVRASGNGFKWREKDCTAQNGILEYSFEYSDIYTPEMVRKANLVINWEYSTDGGDSWNSAGKSGNVTYVTRNGASTFHTVLEISCYNADGYVAPLHIFNGIWREFGTRAVTRQDGRPMTYYGGFTNPSTYIPSSRKDSTEVLVKNADAHCDGWSNLLQDTLGIQNIYSRYILIEPRLYNGKITTMRINSSPAQNKFNPPTTYNFHLVFTHYCVE